MVMSCKLDDLLDFRVVNAVNNRRFVVKLMPMIILITAAKYSSKFLLLLFWQNIETTQDKDVMKQFLLN